jgi:lysozyme
VIEVSDRLVEYIKVIEQFRANAYPDAGYGWKRPTIGWGRTEGTYIGETTTLDAETEWLVTKLHYLSRSVQEIVKIPLTAGQHDALVSFAYNVGLGRPKLKGETKGRGLRGSTLLAKLNAGDLAGASAEFAKWNLSNGKIFSKLVERRAHERAWFDEEIIT